MRRCLLVLLFAAVPLCAQNPAATVTINPSAGRRAISPEIYGVAFATTAQLNELNVPLNRWGGNTTTRYNWQVNADNRANDWYFESIAYPSATPAAEADNFLSTTRAANAQPMLTIPMIGWVAKVGPGREKLASFSQAKYGAMTGNDWQWFPDAGNGVLVSTGAYPNNDKNDASVLADSAFQKLWVQHTTATFGLAKDGGIRYYLLDNEPSLWHSTHTDVHPQGATMDEMKNLSLDYAAKIKDADPGAQIVGPEEWGWLGLLMSGSDQQWAEANHDWTNVPDRASHGGIENAPWLMQQFQYDYRRNGRKLLDVFTTHFYPQNGEYSDVISDAMKGYRNRSTRSLWDPAYVDESWMAANIRLIPRLREWVDANLPNTRIGITEYSWGAENDMSGATAQADVLGIFGREGLDLAARWGTPDPAGPVYKAIRMYRNYDGSRSTFGDVSVSLTGPNPDNVASFAALRSTDGALTVMVISKYLTGNTPLTLNLGGFSGGGPAAVWRLASNAITHLADAPVAAGAITATLPAQSITLFVVPPADPSPAPVVASVSPSSVAASGGSAVSIGGANFRPGATLKIGSTAVSATTVAPASITFTAPALTAGTLYDVTVTNPNTLSTTLKSGLLADFNDVPASRLFHSFIERLFRAGITRGCGTPGSYCPTDLVTRAQMAVFLLRGRHGAGYSPLAATGATFADVPASAFGADSIEQLYFEGLTSGCAQNPLRFCPGLNTTRAEMAKFLLRSEHGAAYVPPPATGIFVDVAVSDPFAPWIERLYAEGITSGCQDTPKRYCPDDGTTRDQMAVFLVRTFGLP